MKKALVILLALVFITTLIVGCSGKTPSTTMPNEKGDGTVVSDSDKFPTSDRPITLKMGYDPPPKEITDLAANEFKRIVEERTNGAVKLELYPQNQLGSMKVMFDGLLSGTIDMTLSPWNVLTTAMPEFNTMILPFNIPSAELYWDVVATDEFKAKFNEVANKKGLVFLGVPNGVPRGLITTKPIKSPEDLKGLRVRVMDGPIYTDMFGAWGAGTSVISFAECYTALQQGVIELIDNDYGMGVLMKFFEVAKFFTPTSHAIHGCPMFINQGAWDKLSLEQQKIMQEAAKEMEVFSEKTYVSIAEDFKTRAESEYNVKTIDLTDADRQIFIDASKGVYEKYEKIIGEDFYKWFMDFVDSKRK